jgi:hypothetical protein
MENAFLWWSIISTILALGFLGWDIWQFASARKEKDLQLKEKELHKAQVKIWQHFANGINHNLLILTEAIKANKLNKLKPNDFGDIVQGIQANANSLYTSLNEERLFTEEEIKLRQLENEAQFKEMFKKPTTGASQSVPVSK